MWVYDFETLRFLAVNDALIHLLGYSREQFLSMTIMEICHPEDLQRLSDAIPKITKSLYFSGPWRTLKKDGTSIAVEITSHSLTFEGRHARFVLVNDITERKQAEEELKASYNLLHGVIEEIIDAIFVKDLRGRYLLINYPGAHLIGKTKEEVIGRDDSELFVPEAARQIMEDDRRIIDSGVTRTYEEDLVAASGLRRTYLTTKGPYRNHEGKIIGVIGIARDITERRKAEDALSSSEHRHRLVLDNIDEIIYMVKTSPENLFEGSVQFVSSRVKNFLGYEPFEFQSDPNLWFGLVHPDDISTLKESTYSIYSTKKPGTRIYRIRHKDSKEYRWMEDRVVPQIDDAGNLIGIFGVGRDITERKHADEMIQHLAYYDVLTGLPNRTLLHDRLQQAVFKAKSGNRPLVLLVMDLDRFKEINNTLGHHSGDIILRQIGDRLRNALPETAVLARTGGDEFAVVLPDIDTEGANRIADSFIKSLKEPFALEGIAINVNTSIGMVPFPGYSDDANTLMQFADMAMYMAKNTKSGLTVYSPQFNQYSPERLALIGELRHSIDSDQMFLLYQPKIDLKTGSPLGVEALVRWQHPRLGVIPPNQFIELAEHTGLIKDLTLWVLKEALSQSHAWKQEGIQVCVAVNLSMQNLQVPELLEPIKALLSASNIAPDKLRLELTESTIMRDPKRSLEILAHLAAIGIHFSIDDFGTGYSSLGYLQRLPVDEVKIDKSFVINMMEDENSIAIVHSIIELAHSLRLKVVAEGVENEETMKRLCLLGCDMAQGYFINRPIPGSELKGWLELGAKSEEAKKPGS